jgi:hypothetical protein
MPVLTACQLKPQSRSGGKQELSHRENSCFKCIPNRRITRSGWGMPLCQSVQLANVPDDLDDPQAGSASSGGSTKLGLDKVCFSQEVERPIRRAVSDILCLECAGVREVIAIERHQKMNSQSVCRETKHYGKVGV